MNKILIAVLVVAACVGGWFLFHGATTEDYVADVSGEIDTLETELAALEADAEAGTLTPEAAATAQAKIAARVDAINAALATSDKQSGLTTAQRKQLLAALTKLKGLFVTYGSVLTTVDEKAAELPEAERRIYYPKGGGRSASAGITALVASVIDAVEEAAEEEIDDYEPEDTLPADMSDAEFETVVEDAVEDAEESPTATEDTNLETEVEVDPETVEDAVEDVVAEEVEDVDVTVEGEVDVEVETSTTTN